MSDDRKIVMDVQPAEVEFKCHACGASCKLFPRHTPMAAVHAETDHRGKKLPECAAWKECGQKDRLYTFLKRCGLAVGWEEADHGPS